MVVRRHKKFKGFEWVRNMSIEPGVEIVTKKLVLNHYHGSLSPDERTFLDQLFEHKMRVGGFFIGLDKPQIHVFEPRILFEKEMEKRGVEVFRCLTEADHYVDVISKIKSDNKAERGFSIETYLQAKKMKIPCTIMVDRLQTSTLDSFGRGISGF